MRQDVRDTLENEVIGIPAIARMFDTDPTLIYRYVVDEGMVDYIKLGKFILVDKEDLDVIEHRVKTPKKRGPNKKY